jgi:hypothetical protein
VASNAGGKRDLCAQQVHAGALELVQRPGLGCGEQPERRIECAGVQVGLRGGQRAVRPPRRVTRQRDRAPQKRGRRAEPAARLGAPG